MIGWECPACGEVNGPYNDRCVNGPHARYVPATGGNVTDAQCTCGTTAQCRVQYFVRRANSSAYLPLWNRVTCVSDNVCIGL